MRLLLIWMVSLALVVGTGWSPGRAAEDPAKAEQKVRTLVGQLKSRWEGRRQGAAKRLGAMGPAARGAIPALIVAAGDERFFVAMEAKEALDNIGAPSERELPAIVALLGHENNSVSYLALAAIRRAGDRSLPALLAALACPDCRLRRGVLHMLRTMDPRQESASAILAVLPEAACGLQAEAAALLERIGPAATEAIPALSKLAEEHSDLAVSAQAAVALLAIAKDAAAGELAVKVIERSGLEKSSTSRFVARALCATGAPRVEHLPRLLSVATWEDYALKECLARVVARLDASRKDVLPVLAAALGHSDFAVREAAQAALKQSPLPGEDVLGELLAAAASEQEAARSYAVKALVRFQPARAEVISAVAAALVKTRGEARLAATDYLLKAGPAAVPALTAMLAGQDPLAQFEAVDVLQAIGPGAAGAAPALTSLAERTHATHPLRRILAALLVIAPYGKDTVSLLIKQPAPERWTLRRPLAEWLKDLPQPGPEVMPDLLLALGDRDPQLRAYARTGLAKLGAEIAVPGLIPLLAEEDSELRGEALSLLKGFGPGATGAVPALIQIIKDEASPVELRTEALLAVAQEIEPGTLNEVRAIVEALKSRQGRLSAKGFELLKRIEPAEEAAPLLLELRDRHSLEVQMEVLRKLRRLGVKQVSAAWTLHKRIAELADFDSGYTDAWKYRHAELGGIRDECVVEVLIRDLREDYWKAPGDVARWLARFKRDERVMPALVEALSYDSRDYEWCESLHAGVGWALGEIGDTRAVKRLAEELLAPDDTDVGGRVAAARALGKLGGGEALAALRKAASDRNLAVRQAAAAALRAAGRGQ